MTAGAAPAILLLSNQGGMPVVELKLALAAAFARQAPGARLRLGVLTADEARFARAKQPHLGIDSFEEHRAATAAYDLASERRRLVADYPDVNWSSVLLAERSFYDASNLQGGIGQRSVTLDYVERLLVELVRFGEHILADRPDVMVAQTPDSLMTLVLYKVAQARRVPVRGLSPAWVTPGRQAGGFLTEDEFLRPPAMHRAYARLAGATLSPAEVERVTQFIADITQFDPNAVYKAVTGVAFGRSPISPNARALPDYLARNMRRREEIEYFKVDPVQKVVANIKRAWRRSRLPALLGDPSPKLPERFVFLPLHFQPEASTLVGGLHFADQAALAETVLKALPFGWSLVVKEHPAGRGTRPLEHYRRLRRYPNLVFCDASSKAILAQAGAVITVTGTIGMEAFAFDKPVIMFGRWFWDFSELVYKVRSGEDLELALRSVLVDDHYRSVPDREDKIRKTLLSYLAGLILEPIRIESADTYAAAILSDLKEAS